MLGKIWSMLIVKILDMDLGTLLPAQEYMHKIPPNAASGSIFMKTVDIVGMKNKFNCRTENTPA